MSSILLVIKANNKIKKEIKNNCKKFRGFSTETYKNHKKIIKLEFEEIKPIYQRELLYKKIAKIKTTTGKEVLVYIPG